ncbi:hypothetical protein AXX17_AT2G28140 [Arabidopsis thaliana]|nr:hypothetical protein AXX17_AT2G28140 [Arabidopsis thaliana]
MGLHELEQWCLKADDEATRSPWDELQHIRQAVMFLVSHQKTQKSLDEIAKEICPVLSIPQVYRIGTMFWDDKYGTQGLSPEVINQMRKLMTEDSANMTYPSFLLDVDSRYAKNKILAFFSVSLPNYSQCMFQHSFLSGRCFAILPRR